MFYDDTNRAGFVQDEESLLGKPIKLDTNNNHFF